MEKGEGSNSERRRQARRSGAMSYEGSVMDLSREGRKTHLLLNQTRVRPLNSIPGTYSTVFDNTSPPYNWLRLGWLAEERRMLATGRLYRYFYDPMGQMYNTRQEVEHMCAYIDKKMDKKNRVIIFID
ncbi:hypothetical protein EUTSA_v10015565mg [Eutrema salsugineum]|uniref:MBD domain-containing protein n=1 Tax=Eutrema salsugineum TaxID=72664 RepID=V4N6T6_EUTSA|nr:uncharacterized protein LOC18018573 [Eutrema salsugineum]ESQ41336.1 hypothetical protein EUTSA_v10015565mg [Eutrema salsugineum]